MKELYFIKSETNEFKGEKYDIYTFIDVFNYQILRATNLANGSKLVKGNKYVCDIDVKYKQGQGFVFFVTKVNI